MKVFFKKNSRSCAIKLVFLLAFLLLPQIVFAFSPEERLLNETQEQRAMNLFLQVRCLVCSGQVIESSNTEFSFEMRKLIRQKISDGKSDEEIKAELVEEFGNDILVNPRFTSLSGFLLWTIPAIFALTLLGLAFRNHSQKQIKS